MNEKEIIHSIFAIRDLAKVLNFSELELVEILEVGIKHTKRLSYKDEVFISEMEKYFKM